METFPPPPPPPPPAAAALFFFFFFFATFANRFRSSSFRSFSNIACSEWRFFTTKSTNAGIFTLSFPTSSRGCTGSVLSDERPATCLPPFSSNVFLKLRKSASLKIGDEAALLFIVCIGTPALSPTPSSLFFCCAPKGTRWFNANSSFARDISPFT